MDFSFPHSIQSTPLPGLMLSLMLRIISPVSGIIIMVKSTVYKLVSAITIMQLLIDMFAYAIQYIANELPFTYLLIMSLKVRLMVNVLDILDT